MSLAKKFNLVTGFIYIAIGIFGVVSPDKLADFFNFTLQNIESQTELMAISGFNFGIGYLIIHFALQAESQKYVLFANAILALSLFIPRIIGLYLYGYDQPLIIKELIFELFVFIIAVILYFKNTDNN